MRLTLRNLLNYMDDMLEPNDAAEIRKKVEESQFASDLLQRTRTVVGRMRLGTPKVSGRGMGVDANTVSDYLDHVLDPEQVQEFEKVCLESDVHLAEVAGCHQILALVLGEPANVDPAARNRMYQLKALRHDKSHAAKTAEVIGTPVATGVQTPAAKSQATQPRAFREEPKAGRREKPEVPDYLRDRRHMPLWSVVATILVATALGAGLWMAFDPNNPISAWLNAGNQQADDQLADSQLATSAETDREPVAPLLDEPQDVDSTKNSKVPVVDDASAPDPTKPIEPVKDAGTPEPGKKPDPKVPDHIQLPLKPELPEKPPKDPDTTSDPDAGLIPEPPGETKNPDKTSDPGKPMDPDPMGTPDGPVTPDGPGTGVENPVVDPDANPANTGPVEVGRFVSDNQLLIRKDTEDNDWFLVPVRAALAAGDRVLALPTYRPTITLSAGVTLQVPGGTSLELLAPDESGTAGVRLYYGRLVLLNNGAVGTQCRVQLGDGGTPREGVISFAGPASTAAIQVHREFRQGENPEDEQTPLVADLFATGGQIIWEEKGQSNIREQIEPKSHIELRSNAPVKRIENSDVFAWLENDDLSKRDLLASPEMKKNFEEGRSVVLSLKELAAHRRFEVRSLAVRSLGHLSDFEPLVVSFNDAEQKANWQPNFESLREALTRGTVVAADVREAFERQRGDDAKTLYRMIWGYSPEQLQSGAAEQLVKDLMHDDLDHRVLAFTNLMDITGLTLLYRADETALRRRAWVRRWQEKLDAGEITHRAKAA